MATETAGAAAARAALASYAGRRDLAEAFLAAPFGRHGPELRFLLDVMRAQPTADKWFLIMTKPYRAWRAARWAEAPPLRVAEMAEPTFTTREAAERWVFRRRWEALIGTFPATATGDD